MTADSLKEVIAKCQGICVLYVEDDEEVRLQTLKLLKICFKNIIVAKDGKEGLHAFKNNTIDLIFTDINMPRLCGLEMIEKIREKDEQVPIIVFSAYDYPDYLLKTIKHGVEGYLLKPCTLQDIVEILQKLFLQNKFTPSSIESSQKLALIEGFYWDKETASLCKSGEEIKLSQKESVLFDLLTSSKQRIFSPEEIEIALFDDDFSDNKRVRNLLSRLRLKLGCDIIESIYGQGYKLRWQH